MNTTLLSLSVSDLQFVLLLFCNFLVSSDIINLGCHYAERCIHSTLSRSLVFYHNSTITMGIILVILVVLFQVV
ncbi:hypothetical protein NC651_031161 [Populus alba x Populus x berolinensis]|nr:hypothetical protein NC651_031161 [Populus alba x Populus x berolinensis]